MFLGADFASVYGSKVDFEISPSDNTSRVIWHIFYGILEFFICILVLADFS